jgi:mannose-6-phosphate isomerase-like protein (cupin superfamily)
MSLWFLNTLVHVRVSHEDNADGISILESEAPWSDSPPLHVHHTEDEAFHVLSGELRLVVGGEELRIAAGETALAPKGVPHTYRVESREGARWLVTTAGGDFERFVRQLSRPAQADRLPDPSGPPTPEQERELAEAASANGIDLLGPPLT